MSKPSYQRRVPRQARSRARVETILQVAETIIAEAGADALKMNDVASRAKISIGSLYQYFPDKTALIHTLTERALNNSREQLDGALQDIDSLDAAIAALSAVIDERYQQLRGDTALRDIWYGMQADKALQHMDIEDSRLVGQHIYEVLKGFAPRSKRTRLRHFLFMNAHLWGATARMATALPPREGRAIMEEFKAMLIRQLGELCE